MTKRIKVLFFTPYAGFTGSEMMLWYLLSHLHKEKFEVKLFAGNNGELLKIFPKNIEVDFARANSSLLFRLLDKLLKKFNLAGLDERRILKFHKSFEPDFWYLNTMVMHPVAKIAVKHKIKYLVHFHELLSQYASVSFAELKEMVSNASMAVGCAEEVCQNLKILGAKKIQKQYECVDFSRINTLTDLNLKEKLQIDPTAFIIVMSGQRIERKGFDLFVETAIRSTHLKYHFIWLGTSKQSGYEFFLEKLLQQNKVTKLSILAPNQNDYYAYLNLADLFFLSSREDPFPLVMLEAAYLGKPILAFDSGGSKEFVTTEIGLVMEEISDKAIDAGILKMKHDIESRRFHSQTIHEHALAYDANNQARLFQDWLSNVTL